MRSAFEDKPGGLGAVTVFYVMFASYDPLIEALGFAALVAAVEA